MELVSSVAVRSLYLWIKHPAAMKHNPPGPAQFSRNIWHSRLRSAVPKTAKNTVQEERETEESVGGFSAGNCRTHNEWRLFPWKLCSTQHPIFRSRTKCTLCGVRSVVIFVKHFLNIPLAVGLIQQLLFSQMGNWNRKKTKQNIATNGTAHSVIWW